VRAAKGAGVSVSRMEAFSDGVIAVAITLLVLDIHVPMPEHGRTLGRQLLDLWPHYAAYVVSFITIGIIWVNHHVMIGRLRETDHAILFLNLLLLMSIAVLPFATSLMAEYINKGSGQHVAAVVYAGSYLAMSLFFSALNRHILYAKPHMHKRELPVERRRQILRRAVAGIIPYVVATAFAPLSPYITLIICGAIAGFYALPIASGGSDDEMIDSSVG
jgi:uncharacterized membrane protein